MIETQIISSKDQKKKKKKKPISQISFQQELVFLENDKSGSRAKKIILPPY